MSSRVGRNALWAPTGTTKRKEQTAEVVRRYTVQRESIRIISAALGWSYGKTYRLLVEAGTPMRPPGGNRARRAPAATEGAAETPSTDGQRS